jgi:hypothetical protein
MMNILSIISVYILENFNATNFSTDWTYYAFAPYIRVLGQFFFAAFFLIPAIYIYEQSDQNSFQTSLFLLIIVAFFGSIIPLPVVSIISIVIGFILMFVLVSKITEKKRQW